MFGCQVIFLPRWLTHIYTKLRQSVKLLLRSCVSRIYLICTAYTLQLYAHLHFHLQRQEPG